MIEPVLSDDAFLDDVRQAAERPLELHLWWLGQSGFLLQWNGIHGLLDPYLSDSLTKKYASTDKPHVRMTRRVVDPAHLDFIDFVTSSHNHTDHLDAETLIPILRPATQLIIPEANRAFVVDRLKIPLSKPWGLDRGATLELNSHLKIEAVPAAHETREFDEAGRERYLGYVIQLGGNLIYHSGDTVYCEETVDQLRYANVDLALLPINGHAPERRVAGNLDGREAAQFAKDIGVNMVVPCHYEMFEFNTATPELFEKTATELNVPFKTLRCGERFTFKSGNSP